MYDVAIVGAGPAGATLARLIGSRYRVLLIDKGWNGKRGEKPARGKCCGGLLAPDAQEMLSRFGLALPKSILVDPQLFSVRTIDLRQKLERSYRRFYMNMDRAAFDTWLLSLVPDDVEMKLSCRCRDIAVSAGRWRLELQEDKGRFSVQARVLVGADGANSLIRKKLEPPEPRPRPYIAIQEWVETGSPMPCFSTFFDDRLTDYYCWSIPKDGCLAIGAALDPRNDAGGKFELLKKGIREYGYTVGRVIQREGAFIERPVSGRQICCGFATAALIGEAAGWISPSSAEGFSFAFKSAAMLAEALNDRLEDFLPRYRALSAGLKRSIILKNMKARVLFSPFLRRLAMGSGLQSIDVDRGATGDTRS